MKKDLLGIVAILASVTLHLFAAGEDNPTGVTGDYNGEIRSGCGYDPYTGNARRTVVDLVVPGGVSKTGLAWNRTLNSRYSPPSASADFAKGGWLSSWTWGLDAAQHVSYPTGETVAFTPNPTLGGGVYSAKGVGDVLRASGGDFVLVRSDGSKVSSNIEQAAGRFITRPILLILTA
jgi:hypothetical protein